MIVNAIVRDFSSDPKESTGFLIAALRQAVLATLAFLFPPSLHAAEAKSGARQFLRTTLGQETLRSLDRKDRRNLLRYAEALLSSPPSLNPTITGGMVRIDAPFATLPPDVALGAETSTNLQFWTTDGIQSLPDGFQIPLGDPVRFIRLTFESLPTAP